MAKAASLKIKLLSTADTGYFYVTKKNARTKTEKLDLQKIRSDRAQARRVQGNEDQVGLRRGGSTRGRPCGALFAHPHQCAAGARAAELHLTQAQRQRHGREREQRQHPEDVHVGEVGRTAPAPAGRSSATACCCASGSKLPCARKYCVACCSVS